MVLFLKHRGISTLKILLVDIILVMYKTDFRSRCVTPLQPTYIFLNLELKTKNFAKTHFKKNEIKIELRIERSSIFSIHVIYWLEKGIGQKMIQLSIFA
ncbi:hypothetical protein BSG1_12146 [Bacillus sp. SG-1]|nr:hypothetical protein BSG1_12146 [Bacillus sp. SG-1]